MRVAVTVEQCWHRVPGGTAVAALAVTRALNELDGPDRPEQIGVAARHREPPPDPWAPPIPVRHLPVARLALYELWSRGGHLPVETATGPVDVVHATTIVPAASRAPLVVTVHDLAFLHDPGMFTAHGRRLFVRCLRQIVQRAALVLCSSSATMGDCVGAGIPVERLRLVLLGTDATPAGRGDVARVRSRYSLDRPFLVFAGTHEPRKNLPRLMEAFARLAPTIDHDLVLVGPSGWGDAARPPDSVAARVRPLGFLPADDLRAVLAAAEVCCLPSVREGFGLPVLEAMAQGTPVVTSRGTSTEEVAGGAAVLVDPLDTGSIAAGITDALARAGELVPLGRRRAGQLTWRATADATLAAYRELAS